MKRRQWLVTGGAVGISAGIGTALWRGRGRGPDAGDAAASAPLDVWAQTFQTADGHAIAMRPLRGRPLLLNFWATWCAPCVSEMSLLDTFWRAHANTPWQVLGLAVDQAEPVRNFMTTRQLLLPVALADANGLDLSRQLGNRAGVLPFSVVFASTGELVESKLGAIDAELLRRWVETVH